MKNITLLLILSALAGGCSAPVKDLKSPCVGAAGSPCDRRVVNTDLPS